MKTMCTLSLFKRYLTKGILSLFLITGTHVSSANEVRIVENSNIYAVFYGPGDILPYPYTLEEWPEEAKQGVLQALGILNETLVLTKRMTIGFMWSKDVDTDHAIALSYNDYVELQHLPTCQLDVNYQYPRELLNQLASNDNYGGENISMIFNSLKNWCFTMDKEPQAGQQDLITVTLHELSHGLGMSSSFTKYNAQEPYIFDKYMVDGDNRLVLDAEYYTNESDRHILLTGDNVYYMGPEGMKANGNKPLKLHAPSTLTGASLCHLDILYDNDEKGELMIPGTRYGRSTRYFGDYIVGILKDVGWSIQEMDTMDPSWNEVVDLPAESGVRLHSDNGVLFIENQGTEKITIGIYSLSGRLIVEDIISVSGNYSMPRQEIYIVKIDNTAYKVRL